MIAPDLAEHTASMYIDCRKFLFFNNLRARIELTNGMVLGRRAIPQTRP